MNESQRRRNRRSRSAPGGGPAIDAGQDIQATGGAEDAASGSTVTPAMKDAHPTWLSRIAWQQTLDDAKAWARRPEAAILVAIVVVAAVLRFWDLGTRAVHHDESLHGFYSWFMAEGGGFIHNPLLHGTVQFIATSFVFRLFGASDATLRLLPALLGVIVVALPYLLYRHRMGTLGALIASALLAISPGILYFSRFARNDIYMILFTLILFWAMWAYSDSRRLRYLVIASATLAIGFATKEIMYLLVLVPITFLFLAHAGDARRLIRAPLREWPPAAVFGLILTTLVLPMGAAGVALFQNILGIHLANPDSGVTTGEGALTNLSGPVGAPISQGTGVTTWIIERLSGLPGIGFDLANLNRIQDPAAGTLLGIQALDIAAFVLLALFGVGAALGIIWHRRHWLIIAGVFWFLIAALFTTLFTNGAGLGSGVWQSLGYWVAQQEVGRGSQPWYYYFMVLSVYELLPLVVALVTSAVILVRRIGFLTFEFYILAGFTALGALLAIVFNAFWLIPLVVVIVTSITVLIKRAGFFTFDFFLIYWLGLILGLLLLAGEKMPWLSIHLTLPIIMIAGRGLGQYLPQAFNYIREISQQADARRVGHAAAVAGLAVLLILTARSSLRASFENGDVPVEMLVYTQTSPALEQAVDEIERYAAITGDGQNIPLTIDTAHGYSWPWHWYLRDYTNVQYLCMGGEAVCGGGAQPVTDENPPRGYIMAINTVSAPNIQTTYWGSDTANRVRIPLRWWFPEGVYRGEHYYEGLGVGDIARGVIDTGAWSTIWTYWTLREPPWRLGSSDIYVYFPSDYAPGLSTPPDPVYGPA